MKIENGILICKVNCVVKKLEDSGVVSPEIWLDYAIALDEIFAVKDTGPVELNEDDPFTANKATIYTREREDGIVLDIDFTSMLRVWLKHRGSVSRVLN